MKKFIVTVCEQIVVDVTVEAEDADSAKDAVECSCDYREEFENDLMSANWYVDLVQEIR